ncbi:ACT domain-containing protein [Phaeovulum sp. W22_SRMD_FR3]|uniref:ACT domain-containing protein n=1 Tax=Phaeovulum sp. W22_SRMD_FR3 TaxID=3240274 RepID=UPI003F97D50F
MPVSVRLRPLPGLYAVARLDPETPIPAWAEGEGFSSISRSGTELSILCRAERVPAEAQQDAGWRCWELVGPFAFDETGIVLSVIRPLSEAGLGIFVVSTFDGDHLLVKAGDVARAEGLLQAAGHRLLEV